MAYKWGVTNYLLTGMILQVGLKKKRWLPSLKLTACPWKWMVGRWVSFWGGNFSAAMLNFGRVISWWFQHIWKKKISQIGSCPQVGLKIKKDLKTICLKRKIIFQTFVFGFHVNFPGVRISFNMSCFCVLQSNRIKCCFQHTSLVVGKYHLELSSQT